MIENNETHEIDLKLMKKNFDRLDSPLQEDLRTFTAMMSILIVDKSCEGIDVLFNFKTGEKVKTKAIRLEEDAVVFTDGAGHLGLAALKCLRRMSIMNNLMIGRFCGN